MLRKNLNFIFKLYNLNNVLAMECSVWNYSLSYNSQPENKKFIN